MTSWVLIAHSEYDDSSDPIAAFTDKDKAEEYFTSLGSSRYYSLREVDLNPPPINWDDD